MKIPPLPHLAGASLALFSMALLGLGCPSEPDDWSNDDDDDDVVDDPLISSVEASISDEMPTVIIVDWTTTEAAVGRAEFGESDEYGLISPWESQPSTEHRTLLLGNPPLTEIHFTVVADDGETEHRGGDRILETGGVASALPSLTLEPGPGARSDGYVLVPIMTGDGEGALSGVAVLDAQGRYVWHRMVDEGMVPMRARRSRDGAAVLFNAGPAKESEVDFWAIYRVDWEGHQIHAFEAPDLHHDFTELPQGGYAYLGSDFQTLGEITILLDTIVEIAQDGSLTEVWHLDEHLEAFGLDPDPADYSDGDSIGHANSIDYIEDDDAYLVSFAQLGSFALIDRSSGALLWVLGGDGSTLNYDDNNMPHWRAHDTDLLGDSLLMFINDTAQEECSQLWEVELDLDTMEAVRTWRYLQEPCYFNYAMGSVDRLWNDHILAAWSLAGRVEELNSQGEVTWSVQAQVGAGFGYSEGLESLY